MMVVNRLQEMYRRPSGRLARLRDDEAGQTPTEYLMIVGLMAVVIITVFVTFYWGNVRAASITWLANVRQAVVGTPIR
jgi:Flp pilus assembly pilin Flp